MAKIILMLAAEFLILMMIIDGSGKKSAAQTCGISYRKIGCFADKRRPFPKLLLSPRKTGIDWENWNEFIERFVCQCANKTAAAGYPYFGIQFWAECWAGENPDVAYDSDGQSDSCVGLDFQSCDSASSSCAGAGGENYVYGIDVDQSSDACEDLDNSGVKNIANIVTM
ncbi:hypothetical protein OS493_015605 [Desmophyllum pertusum]|uniref:Lysozyme n=1 Tax=Desmophyllum pertusum TaxID=174260 RepID=A0A9X0CM44_9CNID|nr:hypothetical protein OS493_015605 [Desmophyllum pertusum]